MNSFISPDDRYLAERFMRDGYVIAPAESISDLERLHTEICAEARTNDLDSIEVAPENLNELKLRVMRRLAALPWAREAYFSLAKTLLYSLIGNELAMQKKFNLNVQLPNDAENLLPLHADTWTGDSAYQLNLWVPFVDCYRTKSMYILPPGISYSLFHDAEESFRAMESQVKYLDIHYGEVLLFNSTLPHGNRTNLEGTTRWTLNCRFKSVWSPYANKGAGEHFEPITLRAASRIGIEYKLP